MLQLANLWGSLRAEAARAARKRWDLGPGHLRGRGCVWGCRGHSQAGPAGSAGGDHEWICGSRLERPDWGKSPGQRKDGSPARGSANEWRALPSRPAARLRLGAARSGVDRGQRNVMSRFTESWVSGPEGTQPGPLSKEGCWGAPGADTAPTVVPPWALESQHRPPSLLTPGFALPGPPSPRPSLTLFLWAWTCPFALARRACRPRQPLASLPEA